MSSWEKLIQDSIIQVSTTHWSWGWEWIKEAKRKLDFPCLVATKKIHSHLWICRFCIIPISNIIKKHSPKICIIIWLLIWYSNLKVTKKYRCYNCYTIKKELGYDKMHWKSKLLSRCMNLWNQKSQIITNF